MNVIDENNDDVVGNSSADNLKNDSNGSVWIVIKGTLIEVNVSNASDSGSASA